MTKLVRYYSDEPQCLQEGVRSMSETALITIIAYIIHKLIET